MTSLRKTKAEALAYYKIWKSKASYSPVFKSYILVTNLGWYHLIGSKSQRKRSPADVIRRLRLLSAARQIIETSTTIQNIRKQGEFTFYALEAVVPVESNGAMFLTKVRVIIIEGKDRKKTFLSVMSPK